MLKRIPKTVLYDFIRPYLAKLRQDSGKVNQEGNMSLVVYPQTKKPREEAI